MKKLTCFAICFLAAAAMLSVTACTGSEPPVTSVTTAETGATGIGNPWKDAMTLEEAAYGANLNDFVIDEEARIDGGAINPLAYKYTDCIAEATYSYAGVHIIIRKSDFRYSETTDIAGTYHEYDHEWTEDVDGMSVICSGYADGEAVKVIWTDGDLCYSILVNEGEEGTTPLTARAVHDLVVAVD